MAGSVRKGKRLKRGRIVRIGGERVREIVRKDGSLDYGKAPPVVPRVRGEKQSAVRGVSWSKRLKAWVARITRDGETVELGKYARRGEAERVRTVADKEGVAAALAIWEQSKPERIAKGKARTLDRLQATRDAKIERNGHPFTMVYPFVAALMGETVAYKGQMFRCDRVEERETRAGRVALIDVWVSHCATCGALYTFGLNPKRDGRVEPFWPIRRCETHRRRGARVDPATMSRDAAALV
jgi:hypothetical protein